jgi:hypothetical protein
VSFPDSDFLDGTYEDYTGYFYNDGEYQYYGCKNSKGEYLGDYYSTGFYASPGRI